MTYFIYFISYFVFEVGVCSTFCLSQLGAVSSPVLHSHRWPWPPRWRAALCHTLSGSYWTFCLWLPVDIIFIIFLLAIFKPVEILSTKTESKFKKKRKKRNGCNIVIVWTFLIVLGRPTFVSASLGLLTCFEFSCMPI